MPSTTTFRTAVRDLTEGYRAVMVNLSGWRPGYINRGEIGSQIGGWLRAAGSDGLWVPGGTPVPTGTTPSLTSGRDYDWQQAGGPWWIYAVTWFAYNDGAWPTSYNDSEPFSGRSTTYYPLAPSWPGSYEAVDDPPPAPSDTDIVANSGDWFQGCGAGSTATVVWTSDGISYTVVFDADDDVSLPGEYPYEGGHYEVTVHSDVCPNRAVMGAAQATWTSPSAGVWVGTIPQAANWVTGVVGLPHKREVGQLAANFPSPMTLVVDWGDPLLGDALGAPIHFTSVTVRQFIVYAKDQPDEFTVDLFLQAREGPSAYSYD